MAYFEKLAQSVEYFIGRGFSVSTPFPYSGHELLFQEFLQARMTVSTRPPIIFSTAAYHIFSLLSGKKSLFIKILFQTPCIGYYFKNFKQTSPLFFSGEIDSELSLIGQ